MLSFSPAQRSRASVIPGLVIDNFAGGGGASTGIVAALGRPIDVAINHDAEAVALHQANHPETLHLCQNVWKADPAEVVRQASAKRCHEVGIPCQELPVELAWFSPDCKHFSKAKGSKPVEKGIRDLAWVVVHWARRVKPNVIMLENVEEFRDWGPLIATADGKLVPCPASKGLTFKRWKRELVRLGYKVEHRELRASHYGAPTIRKRLYVIARRDGLPIVWPAETHAEVATPTLQRFRWAADCIDWSLDCPSIFGRKRELAENTLKRIARGVMRFVVNAERPFIVPRYSERFGQAPRTSSVDAPFNTITPDANVGNLVQPFLASLTHHGGDRVYGVEQPFNTVTAAHRGEMAVVEPFIAGIDNKSNGDRDAWSGREPLRTATVENRFAVVEPFIARVDQTSAADRNGIAPVTDPLRTVHTVNPFALIAPHVTKFRTGSDGHRADEPVHTITANSFIKRPGGAAPLGLVAASIATYYGPKEGERSRGASMDEPLRTQTTENRHSLVAACLSHAYTSNVNGGAGRPDEPARTITAGGQHHSVVAAFMAQHNTDNVGHDARKPLSTIVGWGSTQSPVEVALSDDDRAGAERVAAFLVKYYSAAQHGQPVDEPLHAATAKARFGLVTVLGLPIVDIGMRMLQPRELYRAQGFPDTYIIEHDSQGKPFTKTAQTRMVGNSVCPPVAEALVRANFARPALEERAAD